MRSMRHRQCAAAQGVVCWGCVHVGSPGGQGVPACSCAACLQLCERVCGPVLSSATHKHPLKPPRLSLPACWLVPGVQGDPSAAPYAVHNAKAILGKKPVFGICMGHQILGQAFGGKTFKLKFGHHGGNHPIRHNPSGEAGEGGAVG